MIGRRPSRGKDVDRDKFVPDALFFEREANRPHIDTVGRAKDDRMTDGLHRSSPSQALKVGTEAPPHLAEHSYGLPQDDGSRDRTLSIVAAQAAAASAPFTTKWSRKNFLCSSCSWKFCGVSTAEMTGTLVSS